MADKLAGFDSLTGIAKSVPAGTLGTSSLVSLAADVHFCRADVYAPVLDYLTDPPGGSQNGDRYLVKTPSGFGPGLDENIVEKTAGVWVPAIANTGDLVRSNAEAATTVFQFNGATWDLVTNVIHTTVDTWVDIPGLGLAIAANKKFAFEFFFNPVSAGGGADELVGFNGPATPTGFLAGSDGVANDGAPHKATGYDADVGTNKFNISSSVRLDDIPLIAYGTIFNGVNAGTLIPRFRFPTDNILYTISALARFSVTEIP